MLVGAHGSRVNIDIGVELLDAHRKPSAFQQTAKGGRSNSLTQGGNNSTCNKDKLRQILSPLLLM